MSSVMWQNAFLQEREQNWADKVEIIQLESWTLSKTKSTLRSGNIAWNTYTLFFILNLLMLPIFYDFRSDD